MTRPTADRLFAVLDATWPAAKVFDEPPWRFREGRGGGQRVSATSAIASVSEDDLPSAERRMASLDQRPLFMVRNDDEMLDSLLAARGYEVVDPVTMYLGEAAHMSHSLAITDAMPSWPPLAIQIELWAAGGIGPERIAVMERAVEPKTTILARLGDAPVGTGFASIHDGVAMVHAIEVSKDARRHGVGRRTMQAAANWASSNGAEWVSLAVTRANAAANALYTGLGMDAVTQYHYRRATGPIS